jgi:hypothetical protein
MYVSLTSLIVVLEKHHKTAQKIVSQSGVLPKPQMTSKPDRNDPETASISSTAAVAPNEVVSIVLFPTYGFQPIALPPSTPSPVGASLDGSGSANPIEGGGVTSDNPDQQQQQQADFPPSPPASLKITTGADSSYQTRNTKETDQPATTEPESPDDPTTEYVTGSIESIYFDETTYTTSSNPLVDEENLVTATSTTPKVSEDSESYNISNTDTTNIGYWILNIKGWSYIYKPNSFRRRMMLSLSRRFLAPSGPVEADYFDERAGMFLARGLMTEHIKVAVLGLARKLDSDTIQTEARAMSMDEIEEITTGKPQCTVKSTASGLFQGQISLSQAVLEMWRRDSDPALFFHDQVEILVYKSEGTYKQVF